MTTLEAIQQAYPHPVSAEGSLDSETEYCVLGAACLYLDYGGWVFNSAFPDPSEMEEVFTDLNPVLTDEEALALAEAIAAANDRCDFATAWRLLGEALPKEKELPQ